VAVAQNKICMAAAEKDPRDVTVRELFEMFEKVVAAANRATDTWVDIRDRKLPWRHIVAAAERGEVKVSRVGRKLLMRQTELNKWLDMQNVQKNRPKEPSNQLPSVEDHVSEMLAEAGYRKRQRG
jgi:hypothetical protein